MTTKTLILKGLGCANCAGKIESAVNKLDGVHQAVVNFSTQKLIIEIEDDLKTNNIIEESGTIAVKIEPGIVVSEEVKGSARSGVKKSGHNHEHGCSGSHCDVQHSHGGGKGEDKEDKSFKLLLTLHIIGVVVFAAAFLIPAEFEIARIIMFVIAYLLIGGDVVWQAVKNISRGQVFDEFFLMSIATIGAFAIGEFSEAVAVMLFYQVGEFFQHLAVDRSRKSIAELIDNRPDYANLVVGNGLERVDPEAVEIGNLIVIKPGEKIPLDGTVVEGKAALDTSALTGESLPRDVKTGDTVLSGSINRDGLLTIEVTKSFGESTISKILDMVENAGNKKAKSEQFITRFARYYTPVVVILAVLLAFIPPLLFSGEEFSKWIYRALVFLVISCPCALVVSVPLGYFAGIGSASKNGILVKGGNYLEALNEISTVVFDKTGTLTKGIFTVVDTVAYGEYSVEDVKEFAAHAELFSNHPIAVSVKEDFLKSGKPLDESRVRDMTEIAGHGIKVSVDDKIVLAGNAKLMASEGVAGDIVSQNKAGTLLFLAIDGVLAGEIIIDDEIKADSRKAISTLKDGGVETVMLTGDRKVVGERVGEELGLDKVYAELLPGDKVSVFEKIEQSNAKAGKKGKVVFAGDGINDAPVLMRADVGVAMGGVGSDAAIEAADIVLMTDEPSKLITAMKIARKTNNIVRQNIIFALAVKILFMSLGAAGIANMWIAVFGDVGVALIAILNSMRALKLK